LSLGIRYSRSEDSFEVNRRVVVRRVLKVGDEPEEVGEEALPP
jgi:hypothetical protein